MSSQKGGFLDDTAMKLNPRRAEKDVKFSFSFFTCEACQGVGVRCHHVENKLNHIQYEMHTGTLHVRACVLAS